MMKVTHLAGQRVSLNQNFQTIAGGTVEKVDCTYQARHLEWLKSRRTKEAKNGDEGRVTDNETEATGHPTITPVFSIGSVLAGPPESRIQDVYTSTEKRTGEKSWFFWN